MTKIDTQIKPSPFAGTFYPSDPAELEQMMDKYGSNEPPQFATSPRAIIMPHAGYRFSGKVAASVAREMRGDVRRVIILSPSHRHAFYGIAQPTNKVFETPFGSLEVDSRAMRMAGRLNYVRPLPEAFECEHGIEVILPWVKKHLPDTKIAPFVLGTATEEEVSEIVRRLRGDARVLTIISTDLSHFHEENTQIKIDLETANHIEMLNYHAIQRENACGWVPLRGFLKSAQEIGLRPLRVQLDSSASTSGDFQRVVGYGAWAFHDKYDPQFSQAQRDELNKIATQSIKYFLDHNQQGNIKASSHGYGLKTRLASFITLEIDDRLRGCIGSLHAHRALVEDVFDNAFRAAFRDSRFPPLSKAEFDNATLEISVLGSPIKIDYENRDQLVEHLDEHKDGVILTHAQMRATFLPKIWNQFKSPDDFLKALVKKAGLPENFWSDDVQIQTYSTERFDKVLLSDAL